MEKIKFNFADTDETVEFYILEQTIINGVNYILVTDSEEDDVEALILRDLSKEGDAEALYEILEEDGELEAISKVFSELLEDIDIVR